MHRSGYTLRELYFVVVIIAIALIAFLFLCVSCAVTTLGAERQRGSVRTHSSGHCGSAWWMPSSTPFSSLNRWGRPRPVKRCRSAVRRRESYPAPDRPGRPAGAGEIRRSSL